MILNQRKNLVQLEFCTLSAKKLRYLIFLISDISNIFVLFLLWDISNFTSLKTSNLFNIPVRRVITFYPQFKNSSFLHLCSAYLFAKTGPGTTSFKDKEGDTTTVLNVGKKENRRSTVALSAREKNKPHSHFYPLLPNMKYVFNPSLLAVASLIDLRKPFRIQSY